jgi:phosphate-selective porin OprO and OprP
VTAAPLAIGLRGKVGEPPLAARAGIATLAAALPAAALPAAAQVQNPDLAPDRGNFVTETPAAPEKPYAVPEPPRTLADLTHYESRSFSFQMGVALLLDYTNFSQDAASLSQVGKQESEWQPRAARLRAHGTIGSNYKVGYLVAAEYKGFDTDPAEYWSSTDFSLAFPIGSPATKLTIGKTKETFSYEMVGDAANLPQQERVLNPFFVSRNVGAKLIHVFGEDHRITFSAGVFNTGWLKGASAPDSGTDVSARLTGLVWDEAGGKRYLHLGISGRHVGADNDTLRYRSRPETNVGDYYVDTGNLRADHAQHLGLELLWNEGPFSVLAEHVRAKVSSSASGTPQFSGCYVAGSWAITCETRPYDRAVGYARRIMPEHSGGAVELVARYSHVDLDDGVVTGGKFDRSHLGVYWWATRRWKFGLDWGRTKLDRFGTIGVTDSVLARAQLTL